MALLRRVAYLACIFQLLFFSNAHAKSNPVSVPRGIDTTSRQTKEGDGYGGNGYVVRPLLDEVPPATAIIIHGLGGTGEEWGVITLGMSIFSLNYVKFIIPSAEKKPVTYLDETLPSWFDIRRIQGTNSIIDERDLLRSVNRINKIIDGEVKSGVPEERIFLVGFSQGGALALTTFLRSKRKLGGCVGVATWLPLHNSYAPFGSVPISNKIKGNKILMIHGTEDEAVDFQYGTLSRDRLRQIGIPVNFSRMDGAGHVILTADVIRLIEDYIASKATGTINFLRTLVADLTTSFGRLSNRLKATQFIPIP